MRSVNKKDTIGIENLTHFPFYQNGEEVNQAAFAGNWVDQTFWIPKGAQSVLSDTFLIRTLADNESLHQHIDTLRYLSAKGCDFYFAKFDGVYQLLAIKTPGGVILLPNYFITSAKSCL